MKDAHNWRCREKPRVRPVTAINAGVALIAHIRHLQSGWAYDSRCRYCQLDMQTPVGVHKDATRSIAWYKLARLSGRDRIPLEEYLQNKK